MSKVRGGQLGQGFELRGQKGFLSRVPGCHDGIQLVGAEVGLGSHCRGSLGQGRGYRCCQEPQVRFVLVTNGWRRLDLNIYAGDSRPPQPLRYLALGEWGAGFLLGGEFPGHPLGPQMGPGLETQLCHVGGGGVLGNLMFSTLTPFFVFKVDVGSCCQMWLLGWTPLPSSFPASYARASGSGELVHRARLQKGQSPGGGGAQQP